MTASTSDEPTPIHKKSDSPSAAVQEMERLMGLHDDVMRVLTIKVDAHDEGPSVQMQKRDERDRRGLGAHHARSRPAGAHARAARRGDLVVGESALGADEPRGP